MGFYETYLDLVGQESEGSELFDESIPEIQESGFRKRLYETQKHNYELVKLISGAVKHTLLKPQRVLHDDEDYYIGIDMYTNTYYVCYKNLLMVDIDYYKGDQDRSEEEILNTFRIYCQDHPDTLFQLYRSRNGIHGFLVSQYSDYKNPDHINLMLDLGSDFYYTVYSYLRGWSVRLNKKTTDLSDTLYEYIGEIGTGKPIERLENQIKLHINLVDVFKDTGTNTMHGS